MATAVFTYGGDIHRGLSRTFKEEDGRLRVGDALWEDVLAAPPARANTNVAVGLCSAAIASVSPPHGIAMPSHLQKLDCSSMAM